MNAKERIRIERKIEDRKRMIQIEEMKRMLGQFFERIDWDLERLEEGGDKNEQASLPQWRQI